MKNKKRGKKRVRERGEDDDEAEKQR